MRARIEQLKCALRPSSSDGILLAYSGGTDSAFLLAVLREMQTEHSFPLTAVMMCSPFQKRLELERAEQFAKSLEVPLTRLDYDPFQMNDLRTNSPERCYFCKKFFFSVMRDFSVQKGMKWIFDGTNSDDLLEHRPGQNALKEAKIRSPLAEENFSKQEIRQCSRFLGLATSDLPAAPCLATRFPYGTILTPQKIQFAADCETLLATYLPEGSVFRLRFFPEKTVIEIEWDILPGFLKNREIVLDQLRELGCPAPEIDLNGYQSGKYDSARRDP